MKMEAVLFDLGGTLITTSPVSEVMLRILRIDGVERSLEEIEQARKAAEKYIDTETLPILGDEFWVQSNTQVLRHLGIRDASSLAEKMTKLWWQHADVKLFPDAEETLKALKQRGLKIGLITNGLESDVREILPRIGLAGFFDVETTSDKVGKMKPKREVFVYALERLGVSPDKALFVGDMIEHDYKGAKECGLKALLVDRENIAGENVEKISSLKELLKQI